MRRVRPLAACLLLLAGILVAPGARARDPALEWRSLRTPHFVVHFNPEAEALAQRVARTAEAALARVARELGHLPREPIQMVISDEGDSANGMATVIPYNTVHVFASPPDDLSVLHDYDDYLGVLLLHELSHVVHMDTVSGVPALINAIFGRTVFPNGAQPGWFIEGVAVRNESALSSAGRVRSSLFRMVLRTAALSGTFPAIDELSGWMRRWPQGNAPYLFGGFFLDFLARHHGSDALRQLSHLMSGRLIPWTLNLNAREVLGADYPALWDEWRREVEDEAKGLLSRLELDGLTPFRRLTERAQMQHAPRFSPGGARVLYASLSTSAWPAWRLVGPDGSEDRLLFESNDAGGADFLPDGTAVIFSQSEVERGFYVFFDLYRYDLTSGRQQRLTQGLRAHSPDVSPDGRRVVFVSQRLGRTRLGLLELENPTQVRWLLEPSLDEALHTPRFSPDGKQVVFSMAVPGGGRNLWLLDLAGGAPRRLTHGAALDLDPVFSPNGTQVFFASDRTGVFNLWSLDLMSGALRRITNLATGAFSPEPAPDGSCLVFVVYGPRGFDLARIDAPFREYPGGPARAARPPAEDLAASGERYPVEGYSPLETLWPRSWLPLFGSDPDGMTVGVLVGGTDVLDFASYQASLSAGVVGGRLSWDISATLHLVYPYLYLFHSRRAFEAGHDAVLDDKGFSVVKTEHVGFAELSFPFSSMRQRHFLFFNYDFHHFDRETPLVLRPDDAAPTFPDDRRRAWLGMGWSFSSLRYYIDSISAEQGLWASVSLRYSHPQIGSGLSLVEGRLALRGYLPVWPEKNHVLALGFNAGAAVGDDRRRPVYWLGGLPLRDPLQDSYFGYRYADVYLRGYDPWAFSGYAYALGSAEYRLPLCDIERGVLTLPVYAGRLHAAAFVDVGAAAFSLSDIPSRLKVGLGAELRLDLMLAYYFPMTVRLGYARGLMAEGVDNVFLVLGNGF